MNNSKTNSNVNQSQAYFNDEALSNLAQGLFVGV